jgi:membrane-bound ClpP family serine protease
VISDRETDRRKQMTEGKKGHFLDLKIPLGGLLSFYGLVLLLYGVFSRKEVYARSFGINVNLIWGIIILAVGVALLLSLLRKPRPKNEERR